MALLKEIVPAEFHDREYLKPLLAQEQNAETFAQVFKKLDGAESLLGKREVIPAADAKDEDLDKFFERWRPAKAEDYEIPVAKDAKVDEAFVKTVREAFHAGKISKVQAKGFLAKMTEFGQAQAKTQAAARARADAEFDTLAKTALGEQNKEVLSRVKHAIAEHTPSAYYGFVNQLDDKSLVIMAGVIDAIMRKYVPEKELNGAGKGAGAGGNGDNGDKRSQARALLTEITKMKPMDPEIDTKNARLQSLYKEIAAAAS